MKNFKTVDKAIIDEYGRERIFYGINVCDKGTYSPETKKRSYCFRWNEDMLKAFKEQGYNIIRLGITWDAVEHERGKYDDAYIDAVRGMLDMCEKYGIYAYIDMHQDLYSSFGDGPGDGAPAWACYTDKYVYKNPKLVWAESYFISKATHTAFDNFWANNYGVQDDYRKMWTYVAKKLDGHPALFGYDFMNEPFLGSSGGTVFKKLIGNVITGTLKEKRISKLQLIKDAFTKGDIIHVLDQYTGEILSKIVNKTAPIVNDFDRSKYMPFMNKTAAAVREVSPDPIIFTENSYYSNLGIRCAIHPIEIDGKIAENQLFAPHAYDLMVDTPAYKYASNDRVGSIFAQRKAEQNSSMPVPVLVGEWGGFSEGTEWLPHIQYLLALFDEYKWSSTYWAYFDGLVGSHMWQVLKKPYPRAVTGTINSYSFNRDENTFTLSFNQDREFDVPTEIFLNTEAENVETDGEYETEQLCEGAYLLKIKTGIGLHEVKIKLKGTAVKF